MYKIPRIRLHLDEYVQNALLATCASKTLMIGPEKDVLEKELVILFNKSYCLLTSNGFSSLLLTILSTSIKNKYILIPAASTCFSIVNAIRASGNYPIYADVDQDSGNINANSAEEIYHKQKFELIISPNHFGIPSPINLLKALGVPVIEDCAQSFLTSTQRDSISDVSICSFYATKTINGIDGGALLTDDINIASFARERVYYEDQMEDDEITRFNFRLPNINAAVGLASLSRRKEIEKNYRHIISRYIEVLGRYQSFTYLGKNSENNVVLSKFILKFPESTMVDIFINQMNDAGIQCLRELIIMKDLGNKTINAKNIVFSTCSIPLYEDLSEIDIDYICNYLDQILAKLAK